jgi:hypothetical protein
VKLTTHFHLILRLRSVELYLHSPIHLCGVVLKHRKRDNFAFTFYYVNYVGEEEVEGV